MTWDTLYTLHCCQEMSCKSFSSVMEFDDLKSNMRSGSIKLSENKIGS